MEKESGIRFNSDSCLPIYCSPHRFVLEQLCHLVTGLALVCVPSPVVWHVVDMSQHALQKLLRTPNHMFVWDERPCAKKQV